MSNITGDNAPLASKTANLPTRSLNRVILESKRWKNSENVNMSPVPEKSYSTQRKFFSSNLGRTQTSTPLRSIAPQNNPRDNDDERHLGKIANRYSIFKCDGNFLQGGSSPVIPHAASPEGAYMRQNQLILLTPGAKHTQRESGFHTKHEGDIQSFGYTTSNASFVCNRVTVEISLVLTTCEGSRLSICDAQSPGFVSRKRAGRSHVCAEIERTRTVEPKVRNYVKRIKNKDGRPQSRNFVDEGRA